VLYSTSETQSTYRKLLDYANSALLRKYGSAEFERVLLLIVNSNTYTKSSRKHTKKSLDAYLVWRDRSIFFFENPLWSRFCSKTQQLGRWCSKRNINRFQTKPTPPWHFPSEGQASMKRSNDPFIFLNLLDAPHPYWVLNLVHVPRPSFNAWAPFRRGQNMCKEKLLLRRKTFSNFTVFPAKGWFLSFFTSSCIWPYVWE